MKKLVCTVLAMLFVITATLNVFASAAPELKSESAILIDQESGKVLYEKNAHARMYPASTTKNITALLALENLNLDDNVQIGDELDLVSKDASKGNLKKGGTMSVRELIWALMLPSGNDAAYTIAVQTARKKSGNAGMGVPDCIKYFTDMMNKRAAEIGAKDSHFANPDGYHDDNHYSSAWDLAVIAREAMKNDLFREIVGTPSYSVKAIDAVKPGAEDVGNVRTWVNRNELIDKQGKYYYQYATGIKTGYTSQAGYCLVASAAKDGMKLIAVNLRGPSEEARWADAKLLLDYGFENYKQQTLYNKTEAAGSVGIIRGYIKQPVEIKVFPTDTFTSLFNVNDIPKIMKSIDWNKELLAKSSSGGNESVLKAPVNQGQVIGKLKYTLDGNTIAETDVVAGDSVKQTGFWGAIGYYAGVVYDERLPIGISIVAAALLLLLYKLIRRYSRR